MLDIGLGGSAWVAPTPNAALAVSPSAVEGTLRIRYKQTGMYELAYDDIVAAGLDGFFAGAATANLRVYVRRPETPLDLSGVAGANFSSGDKLRFFLPFIPSTGG